MKDRPSLIDSSCSGGITVITTAKRIVFQENGVIPHGKILNCERRKRSRKESALQICGPMCPQHFTTTKSRKTWWQQQLHSAASDRGRDKTTEFRNWNPYIEIEARKGWDFRFSVPSGVGTLYLVGTVPSEWTNTDTVGICSHLHIVHEQFEQEN